MELRNELRRAVHMNKAASRRVVRSKAADRPGGGLGGYPAVV